MKIFKYTDKRTGKKSVYGYGTFKEVKGEKLKKAMLKIKKEAGIEETNNLIEDK